MSSINMQWLEEQTFFCLLETPPSFFCWASWASSSESDPSPSFAASVPASFFFSPSYKQNRNPVSNYSRAARVLTPVQHSCLQNTILLGVDKNVECWIRRYLGVDGGILQGEFVKDVLKVGEEGVVKLCLLWHVLHLHLNLWRNQTPGGS